MERLGRDWLAKDWFGIERGVLGQDAGFEVAQSRAGVDAELAG
jgi:hypothetical protein